MSCPRAFNQRVVLREHIRSHHSAPDPQHGTTLTPYYCTLCGDLFAASMDLIHHLIEHSDKSTAAKRVQPTGPRKYKRRRKLNDEDASSAATESKYQRIPVKSIKQEPVEKDKIINKKGLLTSTAAQYKPPNEIEEFSLPDEIFAVAREKKTEDKKLFNNRGTASRPKMIFTEKTRVPVLDGRRKTRTMIQKQVLNRNQIETTTSRHLTMQNKGMKQSTPKEEEEDEDDDDNDSNGSETCSNEDDPNEDVLHTLLKRERKLSEKFTIDLVNDLQDILRSPIKTSITIDEEEEPLIDTPNSRRNRRQTFSRYDTSATNINGVNFKRGLEENGQEVERIIIKEEEVLIDTHSCEICGDDFESREELLAHVPIHI